MVDPITCVIITSAIVGACSLIIGIITAAVNISNTLRVKKISEKQAAKAKEQRDATERYIGKNNAILFAKIACMMHLARVKSKQAVMVMFKLPGDIDLDLQVSTFGVEIQFQVDSHMRDRSLIRQYQSILDRLQAMDPSLRSKEDMDHVRAAIAEKVRLLEHGPINRRWLTVLATFRPQEGHITIRAVPQVAVEAGRRNKAVVKNEIAMRAEDILQNFDEYCRSIDLSQLTVKCMTSIYHFSDEDFDRVRQEGDLRTSVAMQEIPPSTSSRSFAETFFDKTRQRKPGKEKEEETFIEL